MIQINLLQESSGKPGKKPLTPKTGGGGLLLIWLAVIFVLLGNASVGWIAWSGINEARVQYLKIKDEVDSVNAKIKKKAHDAEQIRIFQEVCNNQMDVLKSLDPPDRLLWCEKFNMLSNLIPPDVFITDIDIKENATEVETAQSVEAHKKWAQSKKKIGKEPPVVKKPVFFYVMKISGLALGIDNVEQIKNVLNFQRALDSYSMTDARGVTRHFMDGFVQPIEIGPINATVYEDAQVNQFSLTLTTRTTGSDANAEAREGEQKVAEQSKKP